MKNYYIKKQSMLKLIRSTFTDKKIHKWNLKKQVDFFETLADMLKSGFSLKQCLVNFSILYPAMENDFQYALTQLNAGQKFSDCMRCFLSQKIYYQLVIAESHGQLELSVAQLGMYLRQRLDQHEKIKGVMLYPCILMILLILMIFILLTWLRPTLVSLQIYGTKQSTLSIIWWQTARLVVEGTGIALLIYIIYGFYWLMKKPAIARHQWISKLPLVGKVYCYYSFYYLSFNFALLLKSGLDLQAICIFLKQFESKTLLYQLGEELTNHLTAGKEIKSFVNKYDFIPPELSVFLNKGQTSAELSEDLLIFSNTMYQRLIKRIDSLINLIQPVAFLIIAIIIIGIYLSILLPIYSNLGGIPE